MRPRRYRLEITTDASGDGSATTPQINGRLVGIIYTKDSYAAGVDFTVTTTDTLQTLWAELNVDASAARHPRAPTHDSAGAAALYAAAGEAVLDHFRVIAEQITVTVAQGGNTLHGTFDILIEEV